MKNVFYYQTGIGKIGIAEDGEALTDLFFGDEPAPKDGMLKETPLLKMAGRQLQEYLAGKRRSFDLPLNPQGTEFQKLVWKALQEIPYGETRSYGEIAGKIGREKASRAVGMANNKNPIAILIPCHRVIGKNGKLVGYAGGLELKEALLELEKTNCLHS